MVLDIYIETTSNLERTKAYFKKALQCIREALGPLPRNILPFIAEIEAIAGRCFTISQCICGIGSISTFLDHDSSIIRNFAAKVISDLIGRATMYLHYVTYYTDAKNFADQLFERISELMSLQQKGRITLSLNSLMKLDQSKRIIGKILKEMIKH